MTGLDVVLLVSLASYAWVGFTAGFVQGVGSLLGVFVGVFVAGRWFSYLSPVLAGWIGGPVVAAVAVFIILFLVASRAVGLLFTLFNRALSLFKYLPFVKVTNSVGGALLGLCEGVFAVGITLHFLGRLPINEGVANALTASRIAQITADVSGWLVALLPEVLRRATSVLS